MSKVLLVTYASREYRIANFLLAISGFLFGATSVRCWSRKDIESSDFYLAHKNILDEKRGNGYWLWKPYIISKSLEELDDQDILIYADAGILIRRSLRPLLQVVRRSPGIALFVNDSKQRQYTKRDVFIALDCDAAEYFDAPQVHAGIQAYRKSATSMEFIKEVLTFCAQDGLITDDPNQFGKDNLPEFKEHRHDQSILSLLALRKGMTLELDPSQYRTRPMSYSIREGFHKPEYDIYKSCFFVHRLQNRRIHHLIKLFFHRK